MREPQTKEPLHQEAMRAWSKWRLGYNTRRRR
jgi:hypothetical protein